MKFADFLKRFGRSNGQAPSKANASEGIMAASEYARVEAFNRSLCDLLSRDIFIARSDYGSIVESYRETWQLFDALERSGAEPCCPERCFVQLCRGTASFLCRPYPDQKPCVHRDSRETPVGLHKRASGLYDQRQARRRTLHTEMRLVQGRLSDCQTGELGVYTGLHELQA